jgi:hypothetical protein
MLKMNLITRKELYWNLLEELLRELNGDLYWELSWELYREVYRPLGSQILTDFHNSKFRGYNTVC